MTTLTDNAAASYFLYLPNYFSGNFIHRIMRIEQIYTGCLAEAAYYIESGGEAAIIDPLRDVHKYIIEAGKNKAAIKYIFETHFHADFVSGHKELAERTHAHIVFGPTAAPGYKAHIAYDGEVFKIGNITIEALHTPGHSLESTSWLLKDEAGNNYALFTGDTLFIDDAGRPDLVQKVRSEITPHFLAGLLFDSLRNKIMPLEDHVIIYPGHGKGSPCGKKISEKTSDTLGAQKLTNPSLNPGLTRNQFIEESLKDLSEPPAYFPFNIISNLGGDVPMLNDVLSKGVVPLTAEQFKEKWESESAFVIDTRETKDFELQFIPGSVPVSFQPSFTSWIGRLVTDMRQPILLITDKDRTEDVIIQLSRIGYHNIIGCLKGGIKSWIREDYPTSSINKITAAHFTGEISKDKSVVMLHIHKDKNSAAEKRKNVQHIQVEDLVRPLNDLNRKKTFVIQAADDQTGAIAYALMLREGLNVKALVLNHLPSKPQAQKQFIES